jgi:hypothetical protein
MLQNFTVKQAIDMRNRDRDFAKRLALPVYFHDLGELMFSTMLFRNYF